LAVKHRGIEFDIEEAVPSKWCWTIHGNPEIGQHITSGPDYRNPAEAMIACVCKINSELGAANDP